MSTDESTEIDVKKGVKTTVSLKNLALLDVQLLTRPWVFTEKIERTNVDLNYLLFNIDSDLICQSQSELSTSSFRKCLLHFHIRNFQDKNLSINEFIFSYSWWMIKSGS